VAESKTDDLHKQAYLDALSRNGVKTVSAREAGVSYQLITKWRLNDASFREAEELAYEEAADLLEAEAFRRAHQGVENVKYAGAGENIREYTETRYSDTLTMFLLKGMRPEKYRERTSTELSGPGGQPVELDATTAAARLAGILEAARQRKEADSDPLFT
jgi:uncharacterized protein YgiM (DUF1202 family)